MAERKENKTLAVLAVLRDAKEPLSSRRIVEVLSRDGHSVSERTVRLYLQELESAGWLRQQGRRGSTITPEGMEELRVSRALRRVGFLSARIDQMTYAMDFDLVTRSGRVVVNTCLVNPRAMRENIDEVCKVFERGYAMGALASLVAPGERVGSLEIPSGLIGFCTVCSITLNGVLLKHGIPVFSRFGGLLELRDGQPHRYIEIIMYDGTSIDPLEIFIRGRMTDYLGALRNGNGRIGASFREIPADSRERVAHLAEQLDRIGLGGFMTIGHPGQSLMDVPVDEGRAGAIVIGGLNPVAVLEEGDPAANTGPFPEFLEYHRLFHYSELGERLRRLTR